MRFRVALVMAVALFFGMVYLMTLGGCATTQVAERPPFGDCPLPPEVDEGFVRVFCEEHATQELMGCGYVGYLDGQLCLAVVESKACGTWELAARWCGDGVKLNFSIPQE